MKIIRKLMASFSALIISFASFAAVLPQPAVCAYTNSADYIIADSDSRQLTAAELSIYTKEELGYIRNEIYARHGYKFSTAEYAEYFGSKSWYTPLYDANEFQTRMNEGKDSFNFYEQANIMLVYELETSTNTVSSYDYVLPESAERYYTAAELSSLSKETLGYARNEIYARHGWIFSSPEYKTYFEAKSWYVPLYTAAEFQNKLNDGSIILNDYEWYNVQLCLSLETSAVDYTAPVESEYIISDSDSRYLTEAELSVYTKEQLGYIRNEIYARRGYIFSQPEYSIYFNSRSWYVPRYSYDDFVSNVSFNTYEQYNIMLVLEIEKQR